MIVKHVEEGPQAHVSPNQQVRLDILYLMRLDAFTAKQRGLLQISLWSLRPYEYAIGKRFGLLIVWYVGAAAIGYSEHMFIAQRISFFVRKMLLKRGSAKVYVLSLHHVRVLQDAQRMNLTHNLKF